MNVIHYSADELTALMKQMSLMYDIVRIVDPEGDNEWVLGSSGELRKEDFCPKISDNRKNCSECDSFMACKEGKRVERTEIIDGKIFHIVMFPVDFSLANGSEVRCALECITRIENSEDDVLEIVKDGHRLEIKEDKVMVDPLTGLYNWDGFFYESRAAIDSQPDKEWVVIVYDIMSFKLVNDLFGEDKGDEVLVKVAGLIESKCEEGEVCARLRGDLFAVCIHKDHYDSTFIISASKELPGLINSPQFHLHIQGGVYNVTDKNVMVSAMVDRAHLALSTIKGSSERRMIEFDENLMARLLNEQQIITDFKRALLDREFHMFLQPQVSNKGEVKGAEALVRWIKTDNEIVSPGDFLDVLERTDLITDLDKYIWEEAAKTLASWKGTDKENLYISINISPKDFFYMDVYQFIHDLVDKYDLDKKKLKLEITETILMQDAIKQLALVNRLHDEGFDIEIDDFGKGYSSLSLLKDINADVLKIDKEFLQETQNSKRSEDILGTVIDMSDRLAMRVITEGVETREQLEKMIELGCYMFQGYYFAKPMSLEEFESKWTEIGASFNEEKLA